MFDPEFCERSCPICTRARQGNRLAQMLQTVELWLTRGGCPWGRARERKYGAAPHEPIPPPDSPPASEA
jgi:hypothetical protein